MIPSKCFTIHQLRIFLPSKSGLHKLSKNQGATSKFWTTEE